MAALSQITYAKNEQYSVSSNKKKENCTSDLSLLRNLNANPPLS